MFTVRVRNGYRRRSNIIDYYFDARYDNSGRLTAHKSSCGKRSAMQRVARTYVRAGNKTIRLLARIQSLWHASSPLLRNNNNTLEIYFIFFTRFRQNSGSRVHLGRWTWSLITTFFFRNIILYVLSDRTRTVFPRSTGSPRFPVAI
jgi:hypothetical protein